MTRGLTRSRRVLVTSVAVLAVLAMFGTTIAAAGQNQLAPVRAATAAFHDLEAAADAGYGPFYVCTDEAGEGAMGQHYVNGALVGDGAIDPLRPEALVYEPKRNGSGYRLVGVEYVVFQADWDALHGSRPSLFGREFALVEAGNRYGLPAFYELHAWIWRPNPSGIFNDWNPKVSCRGQGDPA